MAVRLYATFSTLEKMTRYRGHFLNWVDTRSLETLPPGYVSTVDSGNLAGSLIALKQGCLAMPQQTVWRWEAWQGLVDLLLLLAESVPAHAQQDADTTREMIARASPRRGYWSTSLRSVTRCWLCAMIRHNGNHC